jgi:hypothetical protein
MPNSFRLGLRRRHRLRRRRMDIAKRKKELADLEALAGAI